MTHRLIKTIVRPDGKRRVLIYERSDGDFEFEEQKFSDDPLEMSWMPISRRRKSTCDSAETAEREARDRIEWLRTSASSPT